MEEFFQACSLIDDEISIKELLLRRYHNLDYIMQMGIDEFTRFIVKAIENEVEEKLYLRWCIWYPHMEKPTSFHEFYDTATGKNIDNRPIDVIIAEIEELHHITVERS